MKAAVELLAEATDVIGSQSRQEVAGIKHKRYAFVSPMPLHHADHPLSAVRRQRSALQRNAQLTAD
jgi:hypothetical protein